MKLYVYATLLIACVVLFVSFLPVSSVGYSLGAVFNIGIALAATVLLLFAGVLIKQNV